MNPPQGIRSHVPLAPLSSWKVGGEAEHFCSPKNLKELKECYGWALENKKPVHVIGGLTNTLIHDEGVSGLVIHDEFLNEMNAFEEEGNFVIEAQSGVKKSELAKAFLKKELHPCYLLVGLPGCVGGGVVMNAGISYKVHPYEFSQIVEKIFVLKEDLSLKEFDASEIQWNYRQSLGWQPGVIYKVRFSWKNEPQKQVLKTLRDLNHRRIKAQPLKDKTCGSTFKNPPGDSSGKLIESCGLKGYKVGGAEVSERHANFIVTRDSARASDIKKLIEHIKSEVYKKKNIKLYEEVCYLGDWREDEF